MHRYLNTWMIDSRVGEVIVPCTSTMADGLGRGGDWCDSKVRLCGSGDVGVKVARGDRRSTRLATSRTAGVKVARGDHVAGYGGAQRVGRSGARTEHTGIVDVLFQRGRAFLSSF